MHEQAQTAAAEMKFYPKTKASGRPAGLAAQIEDVCAWLAAPSAAISAPTASLHPKEERACDGATD